jgi:hypothetical protein
MFELPSPSLSTISKFMKKFPRFSTENVIFHIHIQGVPELADQI